MKAVIRITILVSFAALYFIFCPCLTPASAATAQRQLDSTRPERAQQQALAKHTPSEAEAYCTKGTSLLRQDPAAAIGHFSKAIALNENYVDAYARRALAYYLNQQYGPAIDDYSRAISLSKKNGQGEILSLYFNRALAYATTGDYDRAIQDYTRAIRLRSNFAEAYLGRGAAYDAEGVTEEAISDYTQALAFDNGNASILQRRAAALERLQRYQEALEDYRKLAALWSNDKTRRDSEELRLVEAKIRDSHAIASEQHQIR